MLTFAICGWALFIFVAILYRVGNKSNADETVALAAFSLAVVLSEDYRSGVRQGIEDAIRTNATSCSTGQLVSGAMAALAHLAKEGSQNKEKVNPMGLVIQIVEKFKSTG